MSGHNCTFPLMQAMQNQARFIEAKIQLEHLQREAQRAEKARLEREEMTSTIEDVRKTFEAGRLALARAAGEREQELVEQVRHQTAVVKRQAEEETKNRYAEMMAFERQAVATAINQSVDAKTVSAAVAAARVEGGKIATARAEQEKQELQEQLNTARLAASDTLIAAETR
eukprot:6531826-Pyramimonas_sp.AAC.1